MKATQMTALDLQKVLAKEITDLFEKQLFKGPSGELTHLQTFRQNLPMRQSDDDDDPFPYVIVRLSDGSIESQTDPHDVTILLIVGIYDDNPENNGHDGVMSVLDQIQHHYEANPVAGGAFVMQDPFRWVLQDEESFPYFFGAATTTWSAPAPRREWSQYT